MELLDRADQNFRSTVRANDPFRSDGKAISGSGKARPESLGSRKTLRAKLTRALVYACFPLSLSSPGITVALGLLSFVGIRVWQTDGMPSDLKRAGAWMISGYVLLVLVDVLNGGGVDNFRLTAVNYLPVIAQVPFALAMRHADVRRSAIDRAMQLTILIAIISSIIQWTVYGVERPGGLNLNPNPYGLVVAIWSTILLARGLEQGRRGVLSVALSLLATIPILLTGSKLVWACTFISFGYVGIRWAADHRRWRTLAASVPIALVAVLVAAMTVARERLVAFVHEMDQVIQFGNSQGLSVGTRLELALSGWRAFWERPLLGYGFAERMQVARDHGTRGGPDVTGLFHLHNDYITHLVSFGVFGLAFLLIYFGFYFKIALSVTDDAYRRSGVAIILAVALYMCFEIAFNMDPVSGLMAVHIGLMLAFLRGRRSVAV